MFGYFQLKEVIIVIVSQRYSTEGLSKSPQQTPDVIILGNDRALNLKETRLKKQLSMHRQNNKINKITKNIMNKCFHQKEPIIAAHKDGKEKVHGISGSDMGSSCLIP